MKRQHPILSFSGMVYTTLLLGVFAIMFWFKGQELFSPGLLSESSGGGTLVGGYSSHAEFQAECSRCHQPLQSRQDELCLECHTGVKVELKSTKGVHNLIDDTRNCARCHPDHRGRQYDLNQQARESFGHNKTGFNLMWHQIDYDGTAMTCESCHVTQGVFDISTNTCVSCHLEEELDFMKQHQQDYGEGCVVCHDGVDRIVNFEHSSTGFLLEGKHQNISCLTCHQAVLETHRNQGSRGNLDDLFDNAPSDCYECHDEADKHAGMYTENCAECHNPEGWRPAYIDSKPFEHTLQVGFTLDKHYIDFQGEEILCIDCHVGNFSNIDMRGCVQCHIQGDQQIFDLNQHQIRFGGECLQCHDGVDRLANFDHDEILPLDGRHGEIECESCHENQVFRGTPGECVSCHQEPEIHASFFGKKCQNCHSAQAWAPAFMQVHDFPLNHGSESEVECVTCHLGSYTEYTCYACHEHQPDKIAENHIQAGIDELEVHECTKCHLNGEVNEQKVFGN